jgi:hypothetical protein
VENPKMEGLNFFRMSSKKEEARAQVTGGRSPQELRGLCSLGAQMCGRRVLDFLELAGFPPSSPPPDRRT